MASPSAYVGIEEGYDRGLSCDYVVQGRRVKDLPLGRITKTVRPYHSAGAARRVSTPWGICLSRLSLGCTLQTWMGSCHPTVGAVPVTRRRLAGITNAVQIVVGVRATIAIQMAVRILGGQGEGSGARSQGNPLLICYLAHACGIALTLSVSGFPSPAIPNGVHLSIGLAR